MRDKLGEGVMTAPNNKKCWVYELGWCRITKGFLEINHPNTARRNLRLSLYIFQVEFYQKD